MYSRMKDFSVLWLLTCYFQGLASVITKNVSESQRMAQCMKQGQEQ